MEKILLSISVSLLSISKYMSISPDDFAIEQGNNDGVSMDIYDINYEDMSYDKHTLNEDKISLSRDTKIVMESYPNY